NAAIPPAHPGQSAAPGAAPGQQAPAGSAPGHTAPPPAGQNGTGTETAATPPAGAPTGSPASPSADIVTEVEVPTHKVENPIAVFSGLDKITGRITKFEVPLDQTKTFGALQVRPRACYTRPPTEAPNTTGFVEVDETSLQGEVKKLFRGWMFASSPGLHGVEHPIYDVWLTDCKASATMASAPAAGDGHDGAPKAGQGAPDAPVALPRAHPQRRQQQGTARP
ncbi:DUF2155 domain-containing protein, partial [Rhodovulum sp. PH10]|uniref:DUF2155 domain-containing protein n=1 Tax=Rhodovulum sp. PH10 TaxID=1187851 RepID=UPI0012FAFDAF